MLLLILNVERVLIAASELRSVYEVKARSVEDDTHVLAGDTHPLKYFQSSSRLPLSGSQQILAGLLDLKFQFDFLPTLRVLSESTRPPELFCTNQVCHTEIYVRSSVI